VLETCTELEQIYTKKELCIKLVIYKNSSICVSENMFCDYYLFLFHLFFVMGYVLCSYR